MKIRQVKKSDRKFVTTKQESIFEPRAELFIGNAFPLSNPELIFIEKPKLGKLHTLQGIKKPSKMKPNFKKILNIQTIKASLENFFRPSVI